MTGATALANGLASKIFEVAARLSSNGYRKFADALFKIKDTIDLIIPEADTDNANISLFNLK